MRIRACSPGSPSVAGRRGGPRGPRRRPADGRPARAGSPPAAPWLTAVLNAGPPAARPSGPVAVVVEAHRPGAPRGGRVPARCAAGAASPSSRCSATAVGPVPGGRPPARLLARDELPPTLLADGIVDLLGALRRSLAAAAGRAAAGRPDRAARSLPGCPRPCSPTSRSPRLVDELDDVGVVAQHATRRARAVAARAAGRGRSAGRRFLRAAARLHAAIGAGRGGRVADGPSAAACSRCVDGADRWPWWGTVLPPGSDRDGRAAGAADRVRPASGRRDVARLSRRAAAR